MNGKTTPWEAVILIPFVDENQIINHENLLRDTNKLELSESEQLRNKDGITKLYTWKDEASDEMLDESEFKHLNLLNK